LLELQEIYQIKYNLDS